ncbi:MAG: transglutaminase family protein [bacterium]|nr:transglutaminase family protein [bacterium]MCX7916841.1 transglutaminase family protein [bacterium]MDW8164426.1 transglutaminase family protein [Candidatus Omnitrophota bacterium]
MEKEYLLPTKICDVDNPDIRMKGYILTKKTFSEKQKAIDIFNFVRDEIKYRFDYPYIKASETLKKGYGNCFNKSNLQIALLRSCGIYSGYKVYLIKKEVFSPIVPKEIYEMISQPTIHVSCVVYLEEKWIENDATIDFELYSHIYRNIENWKYIEWDGENDLSLPDKYIIECQGIYSNIDLYLLNPPKFWNDQLLEKANRFIDELVR